MSRIELPTSSLPRKCSTTELQQLQSISKMLKRAGDEIRTRDLQFGRLSLYQLSYSRVIQSVNSTQSIFKANLKMSAYCITRCGQRRIRTSVLVREQIYSLSPLATRPSAPVQNKKRAACRNRTSDLLITNQLLYQLS